MLTTNRLRHVYREDVDCYICLTEFARRRFVRGGLPECRLTVRANGLINPPALGAGDGGYALYVGRLSSEKGVETLIRAWEGIDYPLKIVGDGALRPQLQALAQTKGLRVTFEGFRPRSDVAVLMQAATLLLIPSECYEGFPNTVLEALACGTPMIVSAIGALDELIEAPTHGLKFTPGDVSDLRNVTTALLSDPAARQVMRLKNRSLFDRQYSPRSALESLQQIYRHIGERTAVIGA